MKKANWIIFGVITVVYIAAMAMPFINIFCVSMPDFLPIAVALVLLMFIIVGWKNGKAKTAVRIVNVCIGIFAIMICLAGEYLNPWWNSISEHPNSYTFLNYNEKISGKDAIADIDYAMKYVRKIHPLCYKGMPDGVEKQYQDVVDYLKGKDEVEVAEVQAELQSILSLFHDGHTSAAIWNDDSYLYLNEWYKHEIAGDQIIAINGIGVDNIYDEKLNLYSADSKEYGYARFCNDVTDLSALTMLGYNADDGITYTFLKPSGEKTDETYYTKDYVTYDQYCRYNNLDETEESDEEDHFVYYTIDTDRSLATLTLNSCNYNQEYRNCLKSMFTEIQDKNIQNVAVDLRNNGGGASAVVNEFIRYLNVDTYRGMGSKVRYGCFYVNANEGICKNKKYNDLTFKGNVYVLTSVYTYSSAMDFAMYIKDNNMGKIIGQASGNNPSSYGDISQIYLKNSGLVMSVSIKKWYRIDPQKDGELIEPDFECSPGDEFEKLYSIIDTKKQ